MYKNKYIGQGESTSDQPQIHLYIVSTIYFKIKILNLNRILSNLKYFKNINI